MRRPKARLTGTVLLFVMLTTGCATHYQLAPVIGEGDYVYTSKGKPVIVREDDSLRVAVSVYKDRMVKYAELYAFCENNTSRTIHFDPEQITVNVDKRNRFRTVRVHGKADLQRKISDAQGLTSFFHIFSLVATVAAPEKEVVTEVETDKEGHRQVVYKEKTDWSATLNELGEVNDTFNSQFDELHEKEMEMDALMDPVDLLPGESADGVIYLDDRMFRGEKVIVTVPVDDKKYEFQLIVGAD